LVQEFRPLLHCAGVTSIHIRVPAAARLRRAIGWRLTMSEIRVSDVKELVSSRAQAHARYGMDTSGVIEVLTNDSGDPVSACCRLGRLPGVTIHYTIAMRRGVAASTDRAHRHWADRRSMDRQMPVCHGAYGRMDSPKNVQEFSASGSEATR